jgi:hypothetical protein
MTESCRRICMCAFDGLYALLCAGAVFFLARSVGDWWKFEIADGLAIIAVAAYFAAKACFHDDNQGLTRQDSSVSPSAHASEQGR